MPPQTGTDGTASRPSLQPVLLARFSRNVLNRIREAGDGVELVVNRKEGVGVTGRIRVGSDNGGIPVNLRLGRFPHPIIYKSKAPSSSASPDGGSGDKDAGAVWEGQGRVIGKLHSTVEVPPSNQYHAQQQSTKPIATPSAARPRPISSTSDNAGDTSLHYQQRRHQEPPIITITKFQSAVVDFLLREGPTSYERLVHAMNIRKPGSVLPAISILRPDGLYELRPEFASTKNYQVAQPFSGNIGGRGFESGASQYETMDLMPLGASSNSNNNNNNSASANSKIPNPPSALPNAKGATSQLPSTSPRSTAGPAGTSAAGRGHQRRLSKVPNVLAPTLTRKKPGLTAMAGHSQQHQAARPGINTTTTITTAAATTTHSRTASSFIPGASNGGGSADQVRPNDASSKSPERQPKKSPEKQAETLAAGNSDNINSDREEGEASDQEVCSADNQPPTHSSAKAKDQSSTILPRPKRRSSSVTSAVDSKIGQDPDESPDRNGRNGDGSDRRRSKSPRLEEEPRSKSKSRTLHQCTSGGSNGHFLASSENSKRQDPSPRDFHRKRYQDEDDQHHSRRRYRSGSLDNGNSFHHRPDHNETCGNDINNKSSSSSSSSDANNSSGNYQSYHHHQQNDRHSTTSHRPLPSDEKEDFLRSSRGQSSYYHYRPGTEGGKDSRDQRDRDSRRGHGRVRTAEQTATSSPLSPPSLISKRTKVTRTSTSSREDDDQVKTETDTKSAIKDSAALRRELSDPLVDEESIDTIEDLQRAISKLKTKYSEYCRLRLLLDERCQIFAQLQDMVKQLHGECDEARRQRMLLRSRRWSVDADNDVNPGQSDEEGGLGLELDPFDGSRCALVTLLDGELTAPPPRDSGGRNVKYYAVVGGDIPGGSSGNNADLPLPAAADYCDAVNGSTEEDRPVYWLVELTSQDMKQGAYIVIHHSHRRKRRMLEREVALWRLYNEVQQAYSWFNRSDEIAAWASQYRELHREIEAMGPRIADAYQQLCGDDKSRDGHQQHRSADFVNLSIEKYIASDGTL